MPVCSLEGRSQGVPLVSQSLPDKVALVNIAVNIMGGWVGGGGGEGG